MSRRVDIRRERNLMQARIHAIWRGDVRDERSKRRRVHGLRPILVPGPETETINLSDSDTPSPSRRNRRRQVLHPEINNFRMETNAKLRELHANQQLVIALENFTTEVGRVIDGQILAFGITNYLQGTLTEQQLELVEERLAPTEAKARMENWIALMTKGFEHCPSANPAAWRDDLECRPLLDVLRNYATTFLNQLNRIEHAPY